MASEFARIQQGVKHGHEGGLAAAAEAASPPHHQPLDTSSVFSKYAVPIVVVYLTIGTVFYTFEEGWEWPDALYFCVVTMTTVGYGDVVPTTDLSKGFTVGFILLGLSLVATSLGVLLGQLQSTLEAIAPRSLPAGQRHVREAATAVFTVVLLLACGAAFVFVVEGWSLLDSIYWAVVTCSTVGYGDLATEEEVSRWFNTAYMFIACGGMAFALSKFGAIIMDVETELQVNAFVERGVTPAMIRDMDHDGNGAIDRGEFAMYMLVAMGKVEEADVAKVMSMFDSLDADGSGTIDLDDVRAANEKKSRFADNLARAKAADASRAFVPTPTKLETLKKPLLPS